MASIRELHQQLVSKARSAVEIVEDTLARIEAVESQVGSFITLQ